MLIGERLDIFSWDQEQDKDVSPVPPLCNIVLKMVFRAIGQEKTIEDIQDWKGRNKFYLFSYDRILNRETLTEYTKILLTLINKFNKVVG